tara:strand:+ start:77 stop:307 length:231 start_codon:yes stop_codon:yes gene_type:complete
MAYDESGTEKEIKSLLSRYPAPRRSRAKGVDGGVYTSEMGPPPQDIDGASVRPVKKAKGGKIDGCAQRGKTRGKVV